ncbi:DUF1269 domain-containing protein [Roseovarius salis]|uniref:DUF1269 domain-containing protein n=1 Tax=Roseovarius salis TaxID=3376063 RepID=UPI0037C4F754
MSELLIITFDDESSAFELEQHLGPLRAGNWLETQDTTILTRDAAGEVHMQRPVNVPLAQAAGGSLWGLVIGAAFAVPVAGAVTGAAAGAVLGRERDPGVNTAFLEEIADSLRPGGSALCLLVRNLDVSALEEALARFGKRGHLIQSPLTEDEEAALRARLSGAAQA